jgi:hypothetical protein
MSLKNLEAVIPYKDIKDIFKKDKLEKFLKNIP